MMQKITQLVLKFRTGGIVLSDQAVVSGSNFLLGVLLTRELGLEGFGTYSLLWMGVLFALSFSQAFIVQPMLSLGPKQDLDEYLPRVLSIQLAFSLMAGILAVITLNLANWFNLLPEVGAYLFWFPVLIACYLFYDFCRKYFFLTRQAEWALIIDSFYVLLLFGLLIWKVWTAELTIAWTINALVIAQTGAIALAIWKLPRPAIKWTGLRIVSIQHYHFSKWLMGTALLQWFSGNYFLLAAAALLGSAALGALRMVQNVVGLLHVLFLAMENIIPIQAASTYHEGGMDQLRKYLWKISLQTGAVTFLILLGLMLASKSILFFLYGEVTVGYSFVLIGMAMVYVLVFIGHPLRFALRTLENTRPIFWAYLLSAAFTILAAYPLVGRLGLTGVLIGLFLTQLITQCVYFFHLKKEGFFYENYSLGTRKS